ncbi:MAG: two-component regulator propeller domain-containing protein [Cytophagales bacterium]
MRIFYLFIFTIFILPAKEHLFFSHLSLNPVSEEEKVWDFAQDHNGVLWIAGNNGLYKYTGDKVLNYVNSPFNINSITFNKVIKLFVDSDNKLWVSTASGLNIFDSKRNIFKNYINSPNSLLGHFKKTVTDIYEDTTHGYFWILDYKKGLYKYNSRTNKLVFYGLNTPEECLYQKFIFKEGKIYIASSVGVLVFNTRTNTYESNLNHFTRPDYIYTFREFIFIAGPEGLIKYNIQTGIYTKITLNKNTQNVSSITEMNNMLYVGCDGNGLQVVNPVTNEVKVYDTDDESQLNTNNITSVYCDKKGILWVGTYMHGVNFSSYYNKFFGTVTNGLNKYTGTNNVIIKCVTTDNDGNTWVGTDRGGVFKYESSGEFWPLGDHSYFANLAITDMQWSGDELCMTTFGNGIVKYNKSTGEFKEYNIQNSKLKTNNLKSLFNDSHGNWWFGSFEFGIYKLNNDGDFEVFESKKYGYNASYISDIKEDKNSNLWFATDDGLLKYNPYAKVFKKYKISQLSNNSDVANLINDIIYLPQENELLLASHAGGLYKFKISSGNFTDLQINDFAKEGAIISMSLDKNRNLWLASKNAICYYDFKNLKIINILSANTGVLVNSIASNSGVCNSAGQILFGSDFGLIRIEPKNYKINSIAPSVIINNLKSFRRIKNSQGKDSVEVRVFNTDKELVLDYDENDIQISFSALNYINPLGNKYKYKLVGFDKNWRYADSRLIAEYINVPSGSYVFEIKAANNDGIWNSESEKLQISIKYPWWSSPVAFIAYILTFLMLIYLMMWYRTLSIRKRNKWLQRKVEEQTKELSDANSNLKILLYKTTHDVRGPIKSLATLAELGLNEAEEPNSKMYLGHIYTSSKRIETIVEDLLIASNPNIVKETVEITDFEQLIKESISALKHINGADRINITYKINNTSTKFLSSKTGLQSVVQNLIENPIKYQDYKKMNANLYITFDINDKEAVFTFEDNGVGVPVKQKDKIFEMFYRAHNVATGSGLGLYITKTIVDKLNGKIEVESKEGEGSIFKVFIPNRVS